MFYVRWFGNPFFVYEVLCFCVVSHVIFLFDSCINGFGVCIGCCCWHTVTLSVYGRGKVGNLFRLFLLFIVLFLELIRHSWLGI